jgi:hypothetical protein
VTGTARRCSAPHVEHEKAAVGCHVALVDPSRMLQ